MNFFILPVRRTLPSLRSLPPFYYLKIVGSQNVCVRLSTSQPLPCRLHSLFYYWYALSMLHMSIRWAGYALPGAMWLICLVCRVQTEGLWLKCATFTVELVASFTVGIHRRNTLDTCGYLLYRDGALYSGVLFCSSSPTDIAVSKVSPSILLPQDSLWWVLFVSGYQQDSSYHAICILCSITTDIFFQDTRYILWVYSALPGAIWPKGSVTQYRQGTGDWVCHKLQWTRVHIYGGICALLTVGFTVELL